MVGTLETKQGRLTMEIVQSQFVIEPESYVLILERAVSMGMGSGLMDETSTGFTFDFWRLLWDNKPFPPEIFSAILNWLRKRSGNNTIVPIIHWLCTHALHHQNHLNLAKIALASPVHSCHLVQRYCSFFQTQK